MKIFRLVTCLFPLLHFSCSDGWKPKNQKSHSKKPADTGTLVFTGVDAQFTSSGLFEMRSDNFDVTTLLDGESSDPIVFKHEGGLVHFNRQTGLQNFRYLPFESEPTGFLGADQQSLGDMDAGDPHDFLSVSSELGILANYVTGSVSLLNIKSGIMKQNLRGNWDLPANARFMPEKIVKISHQKGTQRFAILNQGLSSSYQVDGSQSVFFIEFDGTKLTPIDLDDRLPKIQGVPLTIGNPSDWYWKSEHNDLIIIGMCTRYMDRNCQGGVEALNIETFETRLIWSFKDENVFYNGGFAFVDHLSVYANAERKLDQGSRFESHILKISIDRKDISSIKVFPEDSISGFWLLKYNLPRKELYVGDYLDQVSGEIHLYKDDVFSKEIKIDSIPYNGLIIK